MCSNPKARREFNTRDRSLAGIVDAILAWSWIMVFFLLVFKVSMRMFSVEGF
jgi:hypothetical protein